MKISGWGRYPVIDAKVDSPRTTAEAAKLVAGSSGLIPRGSARSYGDSALSPSVLSLDQLEHFLDFNQETGVVECEAGVSLDEILRVFVGRGWFLPVTPGTRFITVGGAIASDIHGKNHHTEGTFADHVLSLTLLLGSGEVVTTSPTERSDLFRATCGGMGLTGIILSARIRLKAIVSSEIVETTVKAPNLDAVIAGFQEYRDTTYSVAWIDCLATGSRLGRSILTVGEHAASGDLVAHQNRALTIPFDLPGAALNRFTMTSFNSLYYAKTLRSRHTHSIPYDPFFYPLDQFNDWNRLYGRKGFVQYQLVLPFSAGVEGLRDVLKRISQSGLGSALAVLKVFGEANENYLSFPMAGYTLALDFKASANVFALLDELDSVVLNYGGRLYLTKDARMSEKVFRASYPNWQVFEATREKYFSSGKFSSLQSQRLGLK